MVAVSVCILEQASSSSVDDGNYLLELSLEQHRAIGTKQPDWRRCGLPRSRHVCSTGYLSWQVEGANNDAELESRLQKRGDRKIDIRSPLYAHSMHTLSADYR